METAHFRIETRIIGRKAKDKAGKVIPGRTSSVVAKAAYRSGQALRDERAELTFNYRSRTQEVAYSEILVPENAPEWLKGPVQDSNAGTRKQRDVREQLWNTIERVEKRTDSQLAREFIASLPRVLTREQQIELIKAWCKDELVSKGFVADLAVHKSKNGQNPHAHILVTMRPVAGDGFGKKPDTAGKFNGRGAAGIGAKDELVAWRESYEKYENAALEKAGRPERVDCRSLKDRGIDRIPEPKMGVDATAMKRRGIDAERFQEVRQVKVLNDVMPMLRAIQKHGHILAKCSRTLSLARASMFLSHVREGAGRFVQGIKDKWTMLVDSQRENRQQSGPDRSL